MALETRGYSTAVVNSLFLVFQDDRQGSSHLSTNHRVGFGCCADRGSRADAAVEEQHIQRSRRWVQVVDWLLSDHLRSMYCLLELLTAGGGIQSLQLAVAAPFGRQVVPSQQGPESIVLSQILCCTEWFARTLDSVLLSERDDCDPLMYACNGSVEGFQRANKVVRSCRSCIIVIFFR